MLTVTPTASTLLTRARSEKGAPDSYGVRFDTTETHDSDGARLAFTFVESARPNDTVLDGLRIAACVASDVEQRIGDVTVDAEQGEAGLKLVVRRARPHH